MINALLEHFGTAANAQEEMDCSVCLVGSGIQSSMPVCVKKFVNRTKNGMEPTADASKDTS